MMRNVDVKYYEGQRSQYEGEMRKKAKQAQRKEKGMLSFENILNTGIQDRINNLIHDDALNEKKFREVIEEVIQEVVVKCMEKSDYNIIINNVSSDNDALIYRSVISALKDKGVSINATQEEVVAILLQDFCYDSQVAFELTNNGFGTGVFEYLDRFKDLDYAEIVSELIKKRVGDFVAENLFLLYDSANSVDINLIDIDRILLELKKDGHSEIIAGSIIDLETVEGFSKTKYEELFAEYGES